MTDCRKVFIDTAPFIYFIEKNENNPQYYNKVRNFFYYCYDNDVDLVSSVITIEEYMVFPYKIHSREYIDLFEKLITTLKVEIYIVDKRTAKKAAQIRAKYKGFKAMDALQLATAVIAGCDMFLTNDRQLRQFREIRCVTIDELL